MQRRKHLLKMYLGLFFAEGRRVPLQRWRELWNRRKNRSMRVSFRQFPNARRMQDMCWRHLRLFQVRFDDGSNPSSSCQRISAA